MKKTVWIIIGGIAAVLVLVPMTVPLFVPWTRLNCEYQDINIKTGQARYSTYIWFVKVSEGIKATPLSAILDGEVVDVADVEPWHRVNTFSFGVRNSPHYRFHGTLSQARELETVFELVPTTPERQREIARTVLALWQKAQGDNEARKYILKLTDTAAPEVAE